MTDWSDKELWKAYIQLTEAEAAFCIHKSDLGLRPIWHQKEDRVLAHILVCFLACVLWKTLSQCCQQAGLGHKPRRVFEELGKIQLVDVVLPTRDVCRPVNTATVRISRARSIGFVRCSLQPASRHFSASPVIALAVNVRIGRS